MAAGIQQFIVSSLFIIPLKKLTQTAFVDLPFANYFQFLDIESEI